MAKLIINAEHKKSKINKEIYGHFSEHLGRCIYEGIYVGEDSSIPNTRGMRNDVVTALKEMKIPVLRWPGGCFADEYHWMDGIGPKEKRKRMINTHWGGVVEDNSFGTHEFMELCKQLECATYINGNMGSGTVQEMADWVEYMTFAGLSPMSKLRKQNGQEEPWQVDYFGVGNENWGCGGNMRPAYYGDEYRRYQTYVRNFQADKKIKKIACGPNVDDYEWTKGVLAACCDGKGRRQPADFMDGFSLHYYTVPTGVWTDKGSATDFDESMYYQTLHKTLFMEELIQKHSAILDQYDPEKKIELVVDEWGTWYNVEPGTLPGFLYQQNTMRDALVAAINLNLFNKYSERIKMANIAQLVNVLQAVILTDGEKMILTPTYHVFKLYAAHQENMLLESVLKQEMISVGEMDIPQLSESVSVDADGRIQITLANLSATQAIPVDVTIFGKQVDKVSGEMVTNEIAAHNTFENPEVVNIVTVDNIAVTKDGFSVTLPACSVMHLEAY